MEFYDGNYRKNLAYDFDVFENVVEKKNTAKIIKLKQKKLNLERFKLKVLFFSLTVGLVGSVALISSAFVFGHSKISEVAFEISDSKKILNEEMSKNISLKNKKESLGYLNSQNANSKTEMRKVEYILNSSVDESKIY